jgi:uncharacterized protein YuzE
VAIKISIGKYSLSEPPDVFFDYDENEQVVGIEILSISKRAPSLNPHELQFQTV